nr:restriction endonuclease subunit S [bacterium]
MKLLQRYFDTALETPDGIKKLRELILTLAMKGKLVPQNPNDQPASELLKKISEEKKRLIKEGKIKKQEPLPSITKNEIPYDLPKGWEWVRLGDASSLITKGSSPNWQGVNYTDSMNGILFITSENVDNYKLKFKNKKYVENKFNDIEPRSILQKFDVLMNIVGASIGRVAYYDLDEIANINQAVCLIRLLKHDKFIDLKFLLFFLNSAICISYMYDKQVDNARANLSMTNINKFLIPLPPFSEQKRIVKKIDQLMALCDTLEKHRNERIQKRREINASALNRLINSQEKKDLNTSWKFITRNFNELYSVSENIDELKKIILQLAMQGKIVPQNPNDQPASELLNEIEKEKKKLIKDGKLKEQKTLPPIKSEEIPYELPNGWEFVRLINLGNWAIGSGFPLNIQGTKDSEIFLCKVSDMNLPGNEKYINIVNNTISKELANEYKINIHNAGTIIFPKIGGAIATNKRRILSRQTAIDNNCLGIKPYKNIDLNWAYHILSSFDFSKYQSGTSVPAISQSIIGSIIIGLPPLPEQRRIVKKIDNLMTLCDTLSQQIISSTSKQTEL